MTGNQRRATVLPSLSLNNKFRKLEIPELTNGLDRIEFNKENAGLGEMLKYNPLNISEKKALQLLQGLDKTDKSRKSKLEQDRYENDICKAVGGVFLVTADWDASQLPPEHFLFKTLRLTSSC